MTSSIIIIIVVINMYNDIIIIIQIIYHITYHFIIVIIIIIKVDHLHGRMYIDRVTLDIDVSFEDGHFSSFENEAKNYQVDSEQLSFDYWKQVNAKGGDFKLSYGGIKKDTKYRINPIRLCFRQG